MPCRHQRSIHRILLAATVLAVAAAAPARADTDADAVPSTADCVRLQLSETDPTLIYDLDNDCRRSVRCTVSWRLTCGDPESSGEEARPPARRESHQRRTTLHVGAGGVARVSISTQPCDDEAWRVDELTWRCTG